MDSKPLPSHGQSSPHAVAVLPLTPEERRRVELPFLITMQAVKFVPEYLAWWRDLATLAAPGEEVSSALSKWREGRLGAGHPLFAAFSRAAGGAPCLALTGPVDPKKPLDLPVERIWRQYDPATGKDVGPGISSGLLEEASRAFGVWLQTDLALSEFCKENPPRPGVIGAFVDLNFGPTDLARGLEIIRRLRRTVASDHPATELRWSGPKGCWEKAFAIYALAIRNNVPTWRWIALKTGPASPTAGPQPEMASDHARELAGRAETEVNRVRKLLRENLKPLPTKTPSAARKRGTRRRKDARENRTEHREPRL